MKTHLLFATGLVVALGGCGPAPELHPPLRSPGWTPKPAAAPGPIQDLSRNQPPQATVAARVAPESGQAGVVPTPPIPPAQETARSAPAAPVIAQASQSVWGLECNDDPIEIARVCYLRGDGATVIGIAKQNGLMGEFISIGFDHYPGSDLIFRVDQNPPIRWPENEVSGRTAELIEQMVSGRTMLSRYTKWPYGTHVDNTHDLTGFGSKLQEMRARLREYVDP